MSDNKNLPIPTDLQSADPQKIQGLTIREIRHRRALVLLQKEFCKEKISYNALKLKNSSPFSKNYTGKGKPLGRAGGIVGKIIGGMNYVDYALVGFSVFSNVRKVMNIFRKKK